jgi:archaellin
MSLKGSAVGTCADVAGKVPGDAGFAAGSFKLRSITFNLALAISGDSIDLNNLVLNYWDTVLGVTNITLDKTKCGTNSPATTAGDWDYALTDGTNSSILSGTTEAVITVVIPTGAKVDSYDTFTVQINPPTGASITLQRSLGPIAAIMSLN